MRGPGWGRRRRLYPLGASPLNRQGERSGVSRPILTGSGGSRRSARPDKWEAAPGKCPGPLELLHSRPAHSPPPGIRSNFTLASFGTESNTGAAVTWAVPSARMVVSDRMSSPTDRSAPSRVLQETSPSRRSVTFGTAGRPVTPTPPAIPVPRTRVRSLSITWYADGSVCSARIRASSAGLGRTASSVRRPLSSLNVTSACGFSLLTSIVKNSTVSAGVPLCLVTLTWALPPCVCPYTWSTSTVYVPLNAWAAEYTSVYVSSRRSNARSLQYPPPVVSGLAGEQTVPTGSLTRVYRSPGPLNDTSTSTSRFLSASRMACTFSASAFRLAAASFWTESNRYLRASSWTLPAVAGQSRANSPPAANAATS